MKNLKIYPSVLSADFFNLKEELQSIEKSSVSGLHIDIMDGHFVPNLTFGPEIVSCIKKNTSLFLDVHLMTIPSSPWILRFLSIGVQRITFHPKTEDNPRDLLNYIRNQGVMSGIAISPDDEIPNWLLPFCDSVTVMSVYPGFSGQVFIDSVVPKISKIKELYPEIEISVDGGINDKTSKIVKEAGASSVVVGKFFFEDLDIKSKENKQSFYESKVKILQ